MNIFTKCPLLITYINGYKIHGVNYAANSKVKKVLTPYMREANKMTSMLNQIEVITVLFHVLCCVPSTKKPRSLHTLSTARTELTNTNSVEYRL